MQRLVSSVLALLALASPAHASERHFAFTQEPAVAESGHAELEPGTTARVGREHYFSTLEAELRVRFGLVPNLEGALSWNLSESSEDVLDRDSGERTRQRSSSNAYAAAALQYKLSDPTVDAVGFALRVKGAYGPNDAAVGGEALISKQSGRLLYAASAGGAHVLRFEGGGTESEQALELDLGFGYFVSPSVVLGVEALAPAVIDSGELQSAAIYAGPGLAFAADHYFFALSVTPQIFAPESEDGGDRDLVRGEYVRARVVFGLGL
jgi:hypothetical protein